MRFLVIGRVLGPVGLAGEVRARVLTDFPDHFLELETVHLGDNLRPYRIQSARLEPETVVLKFDGIADPATARTLRNQDIQIPIDQAVVLPPDLYYWHQVVGLTVWTDDGRELGKVVEIIRTGSNDVYVVGEGRNEILVPVIADVVQRIDLQAKKIIVHLLPGIADQIP